MTERTASWIRTLWPPAVALVAVISLLVGLTSRLNVAEASVSDHELRIRVLEQCVVEAVAHMEDMAENIRWMRDHWAAPVRLPEAADALP